MAPPIKSKSAVEATELTTYARNAKHGLSMMDEGREQWRLGVIELGLNLFKARDKHKDDDAFGKWCKANRLGLDVIDKDRRAALIQIGRHLTHYDPILRVTESNSVRLIVQQNPLPGGIAAAAIPRRHETKPGPKPAAPSSAFERAEALSKERERVALEKERASSRVLTGEVLAPSKAPPRDVQEAFDRVPPREVRFTVIERAPEPVREVVIERAPEPETMAGLVEENRKLKKELMEIREAYEALMLAYDQLCAEKASAPDRPTHH